MTQTWQNASRAYQAAASHRGPRAQEADVFRRTNRALRAGARENGIARARALADNRLLWITVTDLVRDPANALPVDLRAAIASLGGAVQREMDAPSPDFNFLIAVNENIADGLSGGGPAPAG